ncbi:MAG TPA: aminodeoxychorismate/anthranilate synthase component II [Fimbriimonadales bacterium]|nr:aminodeoxychorismate/anthranilate synthase component II [Fimbriimonadales bacterium]
MVLLIDNYDSFTYNIAQYALECGEEILVKRNDEITLDEIRSLNPRGILISPGPCTPDKAGITEDVIREFAGKIPIFGVCLGMQAIGEVFGGKIVRAKRIMHGKASFIEHKGEGIFEGLPSPIRAIRYHSLVVDKDSLPDELRVLATSDDGEIMALQHKSYDVQGVQFHPESVLTEHGHRIVENWLRQIEAK